MNQNPKNPIFWLSILTGIALIIAIVSSVMLYNQGRQTTKLTNEIKELQTYLDSQKTTSSVVAKVETTSSSSNFPQVEYCGSFECKDLETTTSPKNVKFIGWVGSQNAELDLTFDKEKITGKYRDLLARTENEVTGSLQYFNFNNANNTGTQTTAKVGQIELDETKNGLVKGHFSIRIESPGSNIEGIPLEVYKNKTFAVWNGTYKASDSDLAFDLYLATDQNKVKNWSEQTIKGTLVIDSGLGNYFVQTDSGTYFSRESWQFKDRKTGDKVEITGKVRDYFEKRYYYWENQNLETKKGIFNITKIK